MKSKVYIIKIGGNIIDNATALDEFINDVATLKEPFIIVHGGGKLATTLSDKLGIKTQMIDGRRITDKETLDAVVMVYAGLINKQITAKLQARNINAIGLCGADANIIPATKRINSTIDYGFVGDIDTTKIAVQTISGFIANGLTPVFAPITHDEKGALLNTNADTIASELAIALSAVYETHLVYCFEKKGILKDINDENSVIREIHPTDVILLTAERVITDGMLPKVHNAFAAISKGVKEVYIGKAGELKLIEQGAFGTKLMNG